ncbi:MAG: acyltransferase [Flavobacteriia bacterium]|nr:acyltransferase [Flavobacteriia bacterium]
MEEKRIIGFDLLRVIAVFTVFFDHCKSYLTIPLESPLNFPLGSDLFLVLSGYLIGVSVIIAYNKGESGVLYSIKFYIKRWFRTLPNYYLFLLINILLIYFHLAPGFLNKYLISYFFFSQNLFKPYDFLWWESWTLALQEWFYLIFPLLIFLMNKYLKSKIELKKIFLISILMFIFLPLFYRLSIESNLDFDLYFRKIVFSRFDSIGYGLLFSFFHFYYAELWGKYKKILFLIGLIFILSIENYSNDLWYYKKIIKFCILSFSIALLLPYLSSVQKLLFFNKTIKFLSKISFSVYLLQMPVSYILQKYFTINGFYSSILYIALYLLLTISISYLNFIGTESYFFRLRAKVLIKVDNYHLKKATTKNRSVIN